MGYVSNDLDCDDTNNAVNPDADEICDGIDNNCDGTIDTDAIDQSTWYLDNDSDGFGDAMNTTTSCTQPIGYVSNDLDCDDNNNAVNPDADEICDGIDNNCDGTVDTDAIDQDVWYADADNDGFGDAGVSTMSCTQPLGYVNNDQDCDDTNNEVYPGAPGTMEGIDNDCNGTVEGDEMDTSCQGDFNNDGTVDISDLLGFLGNFGCVSDCMPYDQDQDGAVSSLDLLLFLPHYGVNCN